MRLFLSSYRAGNYADELIELFGKGGKVAVITNAKDYKSVLERKESVEEVFAFLKKLNYEPIEIDLRKFFNKRKVLEDEISKFSKIWVAGGNTFVLRRALKYSDCDNLLINKVKNNEVVFGGESAGAILATPDFTGVEFGDDPSIIPKGYKKELLEEGLRFVSYYIVPHYKSEWLGAEDMIRALKKKKLAYKTLTDSQAIIVDGDREEVLR